MNPENTPHHVIFIPGLNDQRAVNKTFTNIFPLWWSFLGLPAHKFEPHWEDGQSLEVKLQKAMELVSKLFDRGCLVSVIGQSAGGSFAFNLFAHSEGKILGAVNICGRLRTGENVTPTLDTAAKNSPAFKQSVQFFESQIAPILTAEQKRHMMTVSGFADGFVPLKTITLEGAQNWTFPMIGHSTTGAAVCIFGAGRIISFLDSLNVEPPPPPVDESTE